MIIRENITLPLKYVDELDVFYHLLQKLKDERNE